MRDEIGQKRYTKISNPLLNESVITETNYVITEDKTHHKNEC
jgi:hypothetical protein